MAESGWCGGSPLGLAVRRQPPQAVAAAAEDPFDTSTAATASCRICMDVVNTRELLSGSAVKLGCRCSASGFDVMHRDCASQWFGSVRKSTVCEVCATECTTMPNEVKGHIRQQTTGATPSPSSQQQQAAAPQPSLRLLSGLRGFSSVPSFLGCYLSLCLLPAAICAVSLSFFLISFIQTDLVVGMSLAVSISSAEIIHWVIFPQRPLLHTAFVVSTLCSTGAGTAVTTTSFSNIWDTNVAAIVGCLVGFLAGGLMFYGVGFPLGLLIGRACVLRVPAALPRTGPRAGGSAAGAAAAAQRPYGAQQGAPASEVVSADGSFTLLVAPERSIAGLPARPGLALAGSPAARGQALVTSHQSTAISHVAQSQSGGGASDGDFELVVASHQPPAHSPTFPAPWSVPLEPETPRLARAISYPPRSRRLGH